MAAAKLELGLLTPEGITITEVNSKSLTNKPELLSGKGFIFFWEKWGLRTYEFQKMKAGVNNTFVLDGITPDKYTLYVSIVKDSINLSGTLSDMELKPGLNQLKKEIDLVAGRAYWTE